MAKQKSKSATSSPKKSSLTEDEHIDLYKKMVFARRFEENVQKAYTKQKFSGFCHLHIGQEALAVGVQHCLTPEDHMISAYRSHTQAFGKGIPPGEVMAELFGKVTGCARGKGGSMHMFSKEHRFYGGHGIVGGQVPIAAGIGFAIRYHQKDEVCICYLGDAAANQGQFFEALNMAATWDLPVLFIIENNGYGMGTDIHRTTSVDHLWKRALGFDMQHSTVDAMNVVTVFEHVKDIIANMRKDKRPYLLDAKTYRYKGHSVSDPGTYRTKDEVKKYQKIDPILQQGSYLEINKIASEADLEVWDGEQRENVKKAEKFADESPIPDVSEAWMHNYVD